MTEDTDRPCKRCVHFMPNVDQYGYQKRTWVEWISSYEPKKPSFDAYRYGLCGVTLEFARDEREVRCQGKNWRMPPEIKWEDLFRVLERISERENELGKTDDTRR